MKNDVCYSTSKVPNTSIYLLSDFERKVECSNKIYSTLQTSVRLTMSLEILARTCMFGTVKSFYTLAKRTVKAERCVSPVSLNQGPEVLTKWLMLSPFLGSSRGTALLI